MTLTHSALCVCVCVFVLVWVRLLHKSKSPKNMCVCTSTTRPRAVPACPSSSRLLCPSPSYTLSPSLSLFFPYNASSSAAAYLKIRSILFGLVVPPLFIAPSLPLGVLTSRCLSRAAFSTAQQIEFPSWTPPTSSPRNLRTCQPEETHAQSSNALPFNVGVTLRRVASPLLAPCVVVWSCTWHFTAKTQ